MMPKSDPFLTFCWIKNWVISPPHRFSRRLAAIVNDISLPGILKLVEDTDKIQKIIYYIKRTEQVLINKADLHYIGYITFSRRPWLNWYWFQQLCYSFPNLFGKSFWSVYNISQILAAMNLPCNTKILQRLVVHSISIHDKTWPFILDQNWTGI